MAEKTIKTRIVNKHASLEEWNSSDLILKDGEIALAYINTHAPDGSIVPTYLMKVGKDGKKFSEIERFVAAPASDVYAWAKTPEKPEYTAVEIKRGESSNVDTDLSNVEANITTLQGAVRVLEGLVGEGGVSVSDLIKAAIEALDVTDTAVENQFVTAVSEVDGKISVTRRTLVAQDISDLGITTIPGLSDRLVSIEEAVAQEVADRQAAISGLDTAYKAADTALGGRIDGAIERIEVLEAKPFDTYATKLAVEGVTNRVATAESDITTLKQTVQDLEAADEANLQAAKGYANSLAGNYDANGAAAQALVDAKEYTDEKLDEFIEAYITDDGGTINKLEEIATWINNETTGVGALSAAVTKAQEDANKGIADAATADGKAVAAQAAADAAQEAADAAQDAIDEYQTAHASDYTNATIDEIVADAKKAGTDAAAAAKTAQEHSEGVAADLAGYKTTVEATYAKPGDVTAAKEAAIAQAAEDATTKANAAEAAAKSYAYELIAEEIQRADAAYDVKGAAAHALEEANGYTDAKILEVNNRVANLSTDDIAAGTVDTWILDCGGPTE